MTKRRKVWDPRAESVPEVFPEWEVIHCPNDSTAVFTRRAAPRAWDAWTQVKGAPAFGSCRVRRIVEGDAK